MVLGHQKGRDTKERAAAQLRHVAARGLSQGAAPDEAGREVRPAGVHASSTRRAPIPGIGAEERGQSEAIGRNIFEMAQLEVPIIVTIIGEGGSGGALAISVGDQLLMLQYSIYSVISPEGCASILWKTAERARRGGRALGITAHRLKALGLVDKIVNEPVGGAHRDAEADGRVPEARAQRRASARSSDLPVQGAGAAPLRPAAVLRPLQRHHRALTRGARAGARVAVAFSGGRDSTALLHATAAPRRRALGVAVRGAARPSRPERRTPTPGSRTASALCRRWARRGLPVELRRARGSTTRPAPGDSVEAWARRARYRALREMALDARRRPGPARPSPPRPGRDLPAAGAARRRRRRRSSAMPQLVRARRRHLGAALARAAARGDRGLRAPPSPALGRRRQQRRRRASRATACACAVWPALRRRLSRRRGARSRPLRERSQDARRGGRRVGGARPGGDRRSRRRSTSPPGARCRRARQRQALRALAARASSAGAPPAQPGRAAARARRSPTAPQRRWPVAGGELRSYRGRLRRVADAAPRDGARRRAGRSTSAGPAGTSVAGWGGALRGRPRRTTAASPSPLRRASSCARAPAASASRPARGRPPRSLKLQFQARGIAAVRARRAARLHATACRSSCPASASMRARSPPPGEPQVALAWLPADAAASRRSGEPLARIAVPSAPPCRASPAAATRAAPHGTDRSQVRRHVGRLARAHPERRAPRRASGTGRATSWSSCRRR